MFTDISKTKSPSYLFRNPHSYCFRMGVPKDLREIFGKREFRYSLRTGRLSEARRKAHLLSGLLWQLYYKIRSNCPGYGRQQTESMVSGFLGFVLEGANDLPDSETIGLSFESKKIIPGVINKNEYKTVTIPIKGNIDLQSGNASIDLQLVEPNFKVKIKAKRLIFNTQKFPNPKLILAKLSVSESASSNPNQQIDTNDFIDLKFVVQNLGHGSAKNVDINVVNNQIGVLYLGRGENQALTVENAKFNSIAAGKHKIINYRYFVNSEFADEKLEFKISAVEQYGRYGFSEVKEFKINIILQPEGYIRKVALEENIISGPILVEDVPDLEIDVDINIPVTSMKNPNAIAVIIGNRNYHHTDVPIVKYARHDAEIMKRYLIKTFGLSDGNILFEIDAREDSKSYTVASKESNQFKSCCFFKVALTIAVIWY